MLGSDTFSKSIYMIPHFYKKYLRKSIRIQKCTAMVIICIEISERNFFTDRNDCMDFYNLLDLLLYKSVCVICNLSFLPCKC